MSRRPSEDARDVVRRYRSGECGLPDTVDALEYFVGDAQADDDRVAPELNRLWIDLEILNAVTLNEGRGETDEELRENHELMDRFIELVEIAEQGGRDL